jgi:hypothetical protein
MAFIDDEKLQAFIQKSASVPKATFAKPPSAKKSKKSAPVPEEPAEETSSVSTDAQTETLKSTNNTKMAASVFALACDAMVRERDRAFLLKVSEDYKIPFAELEAKYLGTAEEAIKVPKVRKAKVTVEGANKCQAQTAKKGPCSFSALKGECFCKRHLAQQNAEPKPPKPPKEPKAKVAKPTKVEPTHTHEPSDEPVKDCELCESHGTALAEEEDFEVVMPGDEVDSAQAEQDMLAESDGEYDDE